MSGLFEASAFTVFLSIGIVGFAFLLLSLLLGELGDFFGGDVDHGGGGGGDVDHATIDVHDAGVDTPHDVGPSFFSSRVIAMFLTAFGGTGAIATQYGLSPVTASLVGFVSGLVFGGALLAFARFMHSQQASSHVRTVELVGQAARVIIAIPQGGVGQVRCRVGDDLVDKIARTHDGTAVRENEMVRIDDIVGEIVLVSVTSRS